MDKYISTGRLGRPPLRDDTRLYRVNLYLNREQIDEMQKMAADRGTSISECVRLLISEWMG